MTMVSAPPPWAAPSADRLHIHAQSAYCNTFKGGDSGDYEKNLRLKIGDRKVDQLIRFKGSKLRGKQIKRTASDYKAIEDAMDDAEEAAENHSMPQTLAQKIRKQLKEKPELPWDAVVAEVAAQKIIDG